MWLVALSSCDLVFVCFFYPPGPLGFGNPFPGHICFCVVRRDRDDDAVVSGPDFSLTGTRIVSLSVYPPGVLTRGERDRKKELSVMALDQREGGGGLI